MLTVEYVNKAVEYIEEIKGDDEVAHSMEDALRAEVLQAIADGHEDHQDLATAALKTENIDFYRWCA